MIILTNTTDKIQVKLGSTVATTQMRCFASYRDTTTTSIVPERNVLNTNNTTYVDLVGSPAASTQRIVDYISIYNSDSGNEIVTVSFNDNGTLYELFVTTLAPGEKIEYQEGLGFKVMSNAGSLKTSLNQGNNPASSTLNAVILGTDVINNSVIANDYNPIEVDDMTIGVNNSICETSIIKYDDDTIAVRYFVYHSEEVVIKERI